MMQITQAVNARNPRTTPRMQEALALGGGRREWEEIFDRAGPFIWDDAVLRVLDSEARREEHRRKLERKLIWCAPAPACASVARPHIFRALFQKDIGGSAGVSDSWFDGDFVAVDGGTGKLQSWVDYVDNAHLLSQVVSGSQVVLPTTDANFAGAKTATFASGQNYVSNRATSLWGYTADGTGFQATLLLRRTTQVGFQIPIATTATASVQGFQIYFGNTSHCRWYVQKTGGAAIADRAITIVYPANTAMAVDVAHSTGSPNFYEKVTGIASATGSYGSAPVAGATSFALTLGAAASGMVGQVRSVRAWRRVLNTAERTVRQQFDLATTGVAA